jgi:hypothetical protein
MARSVYTALESLCLVHLRRVDLALVRGLTARDASPAFLSFLTYSAGQLSTGRVFSMLVVRSVLARVGRFFSIPSLPPRYMQLPNFLTPKYKIMSSPTF